MLIQNRLKINHKEMLHTYATTGKLKLLPARVFEQETKINQYKRLRFTSIYYNNVLMDKFINSISNLEELQELYQLDVRYSQSLS